MKAIDLKNEKLLIDKNTIEPIIIINDLNKFSNDTLNIKIKSGIKACIIELFLNGADEYTIQRDFDLEESSYLEYVKYQDIDENAILNLNNNIKIKDNSNFKMSSFELGLGKNYNNYTSDLDWENSSLNISGLVKLSEKNISSSIFNTTHNAKYTSSNIKYKHSLDDTSKAIFEAKAIVNEDALYSKVLQNSNTILLNDGAAILARPHLEINIDELEASHGATTGSIDKEQLLYLQARGIKEQKAKQILLKAFENEVFDNIQEQKIKEFIINFKRSDYV
jgi:Fe-S cluster assembly protein SufD